MLALRQSVTSQHKQKKPPGVRAETAIGIDSSIPMAAAIKTLARVP